MPKSIVFRLNDADLTSVISKVDRAKLYGYKENEVVDEAGDACEIATLAADGQTLIGKGGTGMGYVTVDGDWCERSELKPVGLDGDSLPEVPSSFKAPIELEKTVTVDEFLDYDVRTVYHLPDFDDDELAKALRGGTIYHFTFSYRGGIEPDPAFLMANADGDIFMLIARETQFEYLALQQTAVVPEETEEEEDDDMGAMDFGMI